MAHCSTILLSILCIPGCLSLGVEATGEEHLFVHGVENITVSLGETAELSCTVDDLGSHKISWIRNRTVLTENQEVMLNDARVSVSTVDNRTWSLHIERVSSDDIGCYTCQVDELESVGCILTSESPVLIDDESSGDVTVKEWERTKLSCRARGHPRPEINWRREDDRKILQIGPSHSLDGDETSLFSFGSLNVFYHETESVKGEVLDLTNIHRGEAGPYLCTASNGIPPDVSRRIQLNVQYAPVADELWTRLDIKTGKEARLECTMSGYPKPKILWYFDDKPINGSAVEEEELEVGHGWRQHKSWRQTLVIPSVETKHYGVYECRGVNSMGGSSSHIRLQNPNPPSTTTMRTTKTPVTTTMYWWMRRFTTTTERSSWTWDQSIFDNDFDEYDEDDHEYGESFWLDRNLALRLSLLRHTLSAPVNVKARALSLTTLMIQWDELEMPHLNVMAYHVYYTSNPALETSMWSSQLVSGNNFTTVSGLTPFTAYSIRVKAYTSLKSGHASPPIQAKTQYGVPSMPVNLTYVNGSATTIKLNWDLPNESAQEPIISYELYWNDTYTNEVHSKSIPVTGVYNLTGLYPSSQYLIWLAAKSKNGEGAPTPPILVSTRTYVLSEPDEVKAELVNSTSVYLKWKPPKKKEQHPLIVGYGISIQETDDLKKLIGEPLIYNVQNGSAMAYLATDLQPDTKYEAQVTALMRQGNGAGSSLIFFKTPGGVPSKPILHVRLLVVKTNGVAIEATWTKPSRTNGKIQSWRLRFGKRSGSSLNLPCNELNKSSMQEIILGQPDAMNYKFKNLEKGCEYEFRLSGCNNVGCGQEAMAIGRTPEGPPTGPPENISFRFITSDIIVISCEDPKPLHCNGRILGYTLQVHKIDDSLIFEKNFSSTGLKVTGQEENIPLYFRIRAYTSKGAGPFSEKIHVSNTPGIVRAPINVQAMATSKDTLEVWWDEIPRESIAGYRIYYNMDETENLELWMQKDISCTSSAELQNLVRLGEYSIQVAALTKGGDLGKLSEMIRVKVSPEEVPLDLWATRVEQNYMVLRWESPNAFVPYKYKVSFDAVKEFTDENGATQIDVIPPRIIFLNRTDTSYTLHGLTPFTTYKVNVSAVPPKKDYRPPASIYITTKMQAPYSLATPKLYGVTETGTIMVVLPQASERFGPISHSFLVVIPESHAANLSDPNSYHILHDAVESSSSLFLELPPEDRPYIAAKFIGRHVPYIFNLGDPQTFNGYLNKPLSKRKRYRIFLRAYVDSPTEPNLFGTSNMSSFLSLDMIPVPPGAIPSNRLLSSATAHMSTEKGNSLWVIGPVIAALLLVSCLALFIYFRRRRIVEKTQESTTASNPFIHCDILASTPSLGE